MWLWCPPSVFSLCWKPFVKLTIWLYFLSRSPLFALNGTNQKWLRTHVVCRQHTAAEQLIYVWNILLMCSNWKHFYIEAKGVQESICEFRSVLLTLLLANILLRVQESVTWVLDLGRLGSGLVDWSVWSASKMYLASDPSSTQPYMVRKVQVEPSFQLLTTVPFFGN